jgi:SpoVK/Ycf46/Vps4 family AAA+-type ATPase
MNDDDAVIQKVGSNSDAITNAVYLNLEIHGIRPSGQYYIRIGDKIHPIVHRSNLDDRTILMNSIQRRENDRMKIRIRHLRDQILTTQDMENSHQPVTGLTVFIKRVFTSKKDDNFYAIPEINREDITTQIEMQLQKIDYLRNNQSYLLGITIGCDEIHCQIQTKSLTHDVYRFSSRDGTRIDIVNQIDKFLTIRDQNLFKFEDILEMGVGGLSSQFEEMFRRAFASRTLDPMVASSLGIEHIRGMMLYGPPGCGKTLIARQISRSMNSVEPIIINGPELMSKYVGESEENIRNVFKAAEAEYKAAGDRSNLHVIIFDEIDSICVHRGSNAGSTGVGDRIVNQLLTKLDGVNELNNIMVIGLTNRRDLIDKALLRPGRFEVQIEIGLPDRQGRIEILNIHTDKLRKNQCLDSSVSIEELADLTANYTGAEIKGLINSARSYALCRAIDEDTIRKQSKATKSIKKKKERDRNRYKNEETPQNLKIQVTYADLMMAMREVTPTFGKDRIISGIESGLSTYGLYDFSPRFQEDYLRVLERLSRFNLSRSNVSIITISGSKGSGKTTIALQIAKQTKFPMVRFVDQSKFVGLTEYALCSRLSSEFEEIENSDQGVIILDDLERLIGFSNPSRMRETVLTSLLTLVDKLEKIGRDRKYVVIFTGTIDVINHITDPRMNLIDPRSVKGRLILPELPLITEDNSDDDNALVLKEFGFESYDAYLIKIREIQNKIAVSTSMIPITVGHKDLTTNLIGCQTGSMPIKYYIDAYNDVLISCSKEIGSED